MVDGDKEPNSDYIHNYLLYQLRQRKRGSKKSESFLSALPLMFALAKAPQVFRLLKSSWVYFIWWTPSFLVFSGATFYPVSSSPASQYPHLPTWALWATSLLRHVFKKWSCFGSAVKAPISGKSQNSPILHPFKGQGLGTTTIWLNAKKQTESDVYLKSNSLWQVCYQGVQMIARDLGGKTPETWYPHFFFFLFWGSRAVSLIVKCSNQICQYLGVRGVRSICWDHVWHDG